MENEKVEIMPRIRRLKKGETATFPIEKVCTIRNNISTLNAKGYRDGYRWASKSDVKKGTVTVSRES